MPSVYGIQRQKTNKYFFMCARKISHKFSGKQKEINPNQTQNYGKN